MILSILIVYLIVKIVTKKLHKARRNYYDSLADYLTAIIKNAIN